MSCVRKFDYRLERTALAWGRHRSGMRKREGQRHAPQFFGPLGPRIIDRFDRPLNEI